MKISISSNFKFLERTKGNVISITKSMSNLRMYLVNSSFTKKNNIAYHLPCMLMTHSSERLNNNTGQNP